MSLRGRTFSEVKKRSARFLLALLAAAAIWLPNLHRFYTPDARDLGRTRGALLTRQLRDPDPSAMRAINPEWDFMRRTYVVLALANDALERPAKRDERLAAIDRIIDATTSFDARHFSMPYFDRARFVDPEGGSLFVDGEVLMMMTARDLVVPRYSAPARERGARIAGAMRRSPSLSAESYPDECWTFCNTTALAALAMLDRSTGTDDHAALRAAWVAHAKEHLVDPRTGILVSSYTRDGRTLDGPEGSSIWMVAHNLLVVDEAFARDQYARARRELGASLFGFAWAREWPRGAVARPDVDSGPIVPLLDASAGSSGLALLGARAFGDASFERGLFASLELAGFPEDGRYRASNDVGDAVVLYTLSFGPLWARVRAEGATAAR
jgi:hypothetical protein